jgi:protein-S-isoprenylcysteine O-methyltransferase Ste14
MARQILKWVDIPPVWLGIFAMLAWVQATRLPVWQPGPAVTDLAGGLLVGGGVVLIALAAHAMRQARTTIIPHLAPEALVTSGIFRRTRNPIYLGDALILAGLMLRWDAWPSLVLLPLFLWIITDRFIEPEEARLRQHFGAAFDRYADTTRRWI